MAVPVKKVSRAQKKLRRSGQKKRAYMSSACPECGAFKLSHVVCMQCGMYKGEKVISVGS